MGLERSLSVRTTGASVVKSYGRTIHGAENIIRSSVNTESYGPSGAACHGGSGHRSMEAVQGVR
jgi:hypothetical protein